MEQKKIFIIMISLMFLIMTSFSGFMLLSNNEMNSEIQEIESLKEKMAEIDISLAREKEQLQTIVDILVRKENEVNYNRDFTQYVDQIVDLIVSKTYKNINENNNNDLNLIANNNININEELLHQSSNNNNNNVNNNSEMKEEKKGEHFLSVLVPSSGELGRYLRPIFCTYMTTYLTQQLGENNFEILFAEQTDTLPFNKAYSYNIAAIFANPLADYFAIHDVDLLPFPGTNYSYQDEVVRLTKFLCNYEKFRKCQQNRWPIDLLGGAFLITRHDFEFVNGMSNSFWGWGGEDNEIGCRVSQSNITILDPVAYQWHIEGVRPTSESHDSMRQSDLFKNNLRLLEKCRKDPSNKYSDGIEQAREHVARNATDFVVFYPLEQVDQYSRSCSLVKFKQANSRKS